MSFLRLCRYFLSKRLLGELVLLLQLVLMLLFGFAVLNPLDSFFQKEHLLWNTYTVNPDRTFHFSGGESLMEQPEQIDDLCEQVLEIPGVDKVVRFMVVQAAFDENEGKTDRSGQPLKQRQHVVNLLLYSEPLNSFAKIALADTFNGDNWGGIAVYADSSLHGFFPVGTERSITIMRTNARFSCTCLGVLQENCAIPAIVGYGSFPEPETLGVFTESSEDIDFLAVPVPAVHFSDIVPEENWLPNLLIIPKQGTDPTVLREVLEGKLGSVGRIATMRELLNSARENLIHENGWNLLAFALLSGIAVFGYGSYLYLMLRRRQQEFSVFYIMGLTRRKLAAIIFAIGAAVLALAFLISGLLTPWFMKNVLYLEKAEPGAFSWLFCGGLLLLILLASVLAGFRQSKKLAEITLYQEAD